MLLKSLVILIVNTMQNELKQGSYRHYSGKEYELVGVGKHSETHETMVVYRALYESERFGNNALWVRPLELFTDTVEIDGKEMSRFTYLG